MSDIVIASAARTPVGSFNGALASLAGHELGAIAIAAALQRAGVEGAGAGELDARGRGDEGRLRRGVEAVVAVPESG